MVSRYHQNNQIKFGLALVFLSIVASLLLVLLLTNTGDGVKTSSAPAPIPSTSSAPPSIPSKKKASRDLFHEIQKIIWLELFLDTTQRSIDVDIQLIDGVLRLRKDLSVEEVQVLSMSLDLLKHGLENKKWPNARFQNETGYPKSKVNFCSSFALLDRMLPLAESDMQIPMHNLYKDDDSSWNFIWQSLIMSSIRDVAWAQSNVLEIGSSLDVKCEL